MSFEYECEIEKKIQKGTIIIDELDNLTKEEAVGVLKLISQRIINEINIWKIANEQYKK